MGANHLAQTLAASELFADRFRWGHHHRSRDWSSAVCLPAAGTRQGNISTVGIHLKAEMVPRPRAFPFLCQERVPRRFERIWPVSWLFPFPSPNSHVVPKIFQTASSPGARSLSHGGSLSIQPWMEVPYGDRYRFPDFLSADARVSKDVPVREKYTLRFALSGFNLTNHFNALDVHANVADPSYGIFFGNNKRRFQGDFDILLSTGNHKTL